MDALLVALTQSAPQLGVGGLLITIIVLLMRREGSAEARHTSELDRINQDRDEEVAELNTRIKLLRGDVEELEHALRVSRRETLGFGSNVKEER